MTQGGIHAFIDESGNEGLSAQPQVSQWYVVVALIIDGQDLPRLRDHFEGARAKHFQGEMKSSLVGKDDTRREAVLRHILDPGYSLYVFVCEKGDLVSPGYRYPKTFVKNLHGRLYPGFPGWPLARDHREPF